MTDFSTSLLPPIEIVPSSEARAIQYQPYIDPATQHIDPSTPNASNAELSVYNELAYKHWVNASDQMIERPLKRKRPGGVLAHRMRQGRIYREVVCEGPKLKRRRLGELGVDVGV
ncbi:hypothetical protein BN14_05674 [Rhizoctonia solani AG-1 IB]|uniref:Uncharacterized protein n=1 Tax=Thanatephorus cucumeris (strain AG1-IB / isolate 7/3/14) TaxID=1108050 RepID=M5C703_THACB|nr:hypothetical protein BN14_05674 [Rhizoctonia solani AG-1 IB]